MFVKGRRVGVYPRNDVPRRLQHEMLSPGKSVPDRYARPQRALPGTTSRPISGVSSIGVIYRYPHFLDSRNRTPTFQDENVKNLLSPAANRGDL